MIVLALDTTTRTSSCAVARNGVVMLEEAGDASRPQAVRLPAELAGLLDRAGIALADVDAFAVAIGPGSFTGLRIGIASMQGLAFAERKPLFGVSALDALASIAGQSAGGSAGDQMRIATWVDAWRGDVYAALYEHGQLTGEPCVDRPADLLAAMTLGGGAGMTTVFVGDGAVPYHDLIVERLGGNARFAEPLRPFLASRIAIHATDAFDRGERPLPHAIHPLYVRRPDAVLARETAQRPLAPTPTCEP